MDSTKVSILFLSSGKKALSHKTAETIYLISWLLRMPQCKTTIDKSLFNFPPSQNTPYLLYVFNVYVTL